MNRPVVIYLSLIVTLIAGLWILLSLGSRLSAPEDLAGRWELRSSIRGIPDESLNIEQSGKFFELAFEKGKTISLTLTDHTGGNIGANQGTTLGLINDECKLTVSGAPDSDDKTMTLSGAHAGRWSAHRVTRTFPLDTASKEGH